MRNRPPPHVRANTRELHEAVKRGDLDRAREALKKIEADRLALALAHNKRLTGRAS
jgi:hypothetical protein